VSNATRHPAFVGDDGQPLAPGWGRRFLEQCEINPDDPADVRDAYDACRAQYGLWLWSQKGQIDDDAYYMLVDAIKDLYEWDAFPLDWPAPTLVRMTQPFRDLLKRAPRPSAANAPLLADAAPINPTEIAALVERTMQTLLNGLPGRDNTGGGQ
jgi:hypothetical protein